VRSFLSVLLILISFNTLYAQTNTASLKANAVNLIEKGKFEEARNLLETIKGSDTNKDLLFLLGFVYLKTGMFDQSVQSFKNYDAAKPDNDEFHYYYALSLYETKQYDSALNEFNKSALIGVKTAPSYYYSGYIDFLRNDCDKALPLFVSALKEEGDYSILSHHYAGICLYQKGFEDRSAFEASVYHFEKVADEKGPKQEEAKSYINAINEYLSGGTLRYKKRYNVASQLNIAISSHRTINPIDGVPVVGVDGGRSAIWGSFVLDLGVSPLLYDDFAFFFNYDFNTNLAFSSQLNTTNVQAHNPGVTFQFYNQSRTFEAYAGYKYEVEFLERDAIRKISSANAIYLGVDQSLTSSWSLGLRIPIRLYSAVGGALGDFSGKSIDIQLVSQHLFGATSVRLEPAILFFMSGGALASFKHYRIAAKFNLPWKFLFLWPSIKIEPGKLSSSTGSSTTYDLGGSLFSPIGLGMKISAFCNAKKGFVSTAWDVSTGISLEYLFQ
jgi:Tfp pilus assembly protein PilF